MLTSLNTTEMGARIAENPSENSWASAEVALALSVCAQNQNVAAPHTHDHCGVCKGVFDWKPWFGLVRDTAWKKSDFD